MPGDGGAGNENKETKKRNKNWTRPETMAAMHAVLGTNEKMANGKCSADRMNSFQSSFTTTVRYWASKGMWVDRLGNPVTTVTPEESIQMRLLSQRSQGHSGSCCQEGGQFPWHLAPKNSAELHEQAFDKKGQVDLSATMQDSPAAAKKDRSTCLPPCKILPSFAHTST